MGKIKDLYYKIPDSVRAVILPTICTGLIAGLGEFLARRELGLEAAAYAALITFLFTLIQEIKKRLETQGTATRPRTRFFVGQ